MLRKFALVIIAVSSLGVATLTPTPASAWRGPAWGPGWGWRRGWGWGGPRFVVAPGFYGGGWWSGVLSLARGDRVGFS